MGRKTKIKFTDFECNLLINGMNEFRNMLLAEDLPTEDVDELLLKIIEKAGAVPIAIKLYAPPPLIISCHTIIPSLSQW